MSGGVAGAGPEPFLDRPYADQEPGPEPYARGWGAPEGDAPGGGVLRFAAQGKASLFSLAIPKVTGIGQKPGPEPCVRGLGALGGDAPGGGALRSDTVMLTPSPIRKIGKYNTSTVALVLLIQMEQHSGE